jgi:hypothetical protein
MKLIRTTALTAALMTAAVPSLTTPANAWGWGYGYPYYGYIGYPAYYGYGFAYPAYGHGYGSAYYDGYGHAYHPIRRHCYGAFCDVPLQVLVAAHL